MYIPKGHVATKTVYIHAGEGYETYRGEKWLADGLDVV